MASPISRLGYFILRPCQLSSSVNSLAISSVIPYPHPHPISSLSPIIISVPYYHICPVLSFLSPIIISVPYYHFCLLLHLQFPVNWHQTTSSQTITSNAITESTNPKSVYGQFGLPMHVWLEDWFSWDLRYRIYCLGLRRLLLGRYMFLGRYRSPPCSTCFYSCSSFLYCPCSARRYPPHLSESILSYQQHPPHLPSPVNCLFIPDTYYSRSFGHLCSFWWFLGSWLTLGNSLQQQSPSRHIVWIFSLIKRPRQQLG